ncbi:MAG: hypothetical protein OSA84_03900 [Akkermansiaceae bacterium]|nr:hypothetical protein [Akkermansiaceae bacterium]
MQSSKASFSIASIVAIIAAILSFKFGAILGLIKGTSTGSVTNATTAYKQYQDVANAKAKIEGLTEEMEIIRKALEKDLAEIGESYDPSSLSLEKETLKPTRTDVVVERVALLWK